MSIVILVKHTPNDTCTYKTTTFNLFLHVHNENSSSNALEKNRLTQLYTDKNMNVAMQSSHFEHVL